MNNMKLCLIIALLAVLASCGADVEKQRRLSREQRKALLRADSAALKIATTPTMD